MEETLGEKFLRETTICCFALPCGFYNKFILHSKHIADKPEDILQESYRVQNLHHRWFLYTHPLLIHPTNLILHKEVDSFEYVDFPILLHNYVNLRQWSIISFYRNHITSERSFLILSTLIEPQQTGTCSFNNRKRSVKDMRKEFSSIKNITKISYFCGFIKLDSKPASIRIPFTDFNLTCKTMF